MPQGRHVAESCSEEVTSRSLGAVVPIATGRSETGCIQEERGAVTVLMHGGKMNQMEFVTVSARTFVHCDDNRIPLKECTTTQLRLGYWVPEVHNIPPQPELWVSPRNRKDLCLRVVVARRSGPLTAQPATR